MMTEERAAPASDDELPEGTSEELPQETAEDAAAKREKDLRDRLAQTGREAADAKRRAAAAQAELAQTQSRVAHLEQEQTRVGAALAKQEDDRVNAYLATLPPERQAAERIKLLEARVARAETRASTPAPAPVARQETDEAYAQRRITEQLAAVKQTYGVDLDRSDPDIVWDTEAEFVASTKILAKRLAAKGQENPVATPKTPANPKAAEAKEIGSGRPTTPRAAGGSRVPPTTEDYGRVMSKYDSRSGPKATIAKLKDMRTQAETAAGRA